MSKFSAVLTALALAMGIASAVLVILKIVPIETTIIILGIGLFAIALTKFQKARE